MINESYAQKYCKDDISKIENYDKAFADPIQTWVIHHRLELTLDGEFAHTPEDLKRMGMYYNRPYFELIFLTKSEHQRIHAQNRSGTTLIKMKSSLSQRTGTLNNFYGKHHSDDTKQKISKANKGRKRTDKFKQIQSSLKKGKPLSDTNRLNKAKSQAEIGIKYRAYKTAGGTMTYNEFRASIKKSR